LRNPEERAKREEKSLGVERGNVFIGHEYVSEVSLAGFLFNYFIQK